MADAPPAAAFTIKDGEKEYSFTTNTKVEDAEKNIREKAKNDSLQLRYKGSEEAIPDKERQAVFDVTKEYIVYTPSIWERMVSCVTCA